MRIEKSYDKVNAVFLFYWQRKLN